MRLRDVTVNPSGLGSRRLGQRLTPITAVRRQQARNMPMLRCSSLTSVSPTPGTVMTAPLSPRPLPQRRLQTMKHTAKPDTDKGAAGRDQLRRQLADISMTEATIADARSDGAPTRYGLTIDGDAYCISGDGWTFDDPACPWQLTAEL